MISRLVCLVKNFHIQAPLGFIMIFASLFARLSMTEFFIAHSSLCRFIILMILLTVVVVPSLLLLLMMLLWYDIGTIFMFNHFHGRKKREKKKGRYEIIWIVLTNFHDDGMKNILNGENIFVLEFLMVWRRKLKISFFFFSSFLCKSWTYEFIILYATSLISFNNSFISHIPVNLYPSTTQYTFPTYKNFWHPPNHPRIAFSLSWTCSTFFFYEKNEKTFSQFFIFSFSQIFLGSALFIQ